MNMHGFSFTMGLMPSAVFLYDALTGLVTRDDALNMLS